MKNSLNVDAEDFLQVLSYSKAGSAKFFRAAASGKNRINMICQQLSEQGYGFYKDSMLLLTIKCNVDASLQMDELSKLTETIQEGAGDNTEITFGYSFDENNRLAEDLEVCVLVAYN